MARRRHSREIYIIPRQRLTRFERQVFGAFRLKAPCGTEDEEGIPNQSENVPSRTPQLFTSPEHGPNLKYNEERIRELSALWRRFRAMRELQKVFFSKARNAAARMLEKEPSLRKQGKFQLLDKNVAHLKDFCRPPDAYWFNTAWFSPPGKYAELHLNRILHKPEHGIIVLQKLLGDSVQTNVFLSEGNNRFFTKFFKDHAKFQEALERYQDKFGPSEGSGPLPRYSDEGLD